VVSRTQVQCGQNGALLFPRGQWMVSTLVTRIAGAPAATRTAAGSSGANFKKFRRFIATLE